MVVLVFHCLRALRLNLQITLFSTIIQVVTARAGSDNTESIQLSSLYVNIQPSSSRHKQPKFNRLISRKNIRVNTYRPVHRLNHSGESRHGKYLLCARERDIYIYTAYILQRFGERLFVLIILARVDLAPRGYTLANGQLKSTPALQLR